MGGKLKKIFPVFFLMLLCMCVPMKVSAATSLSATDLDGTSRIFRLALSQTSVSDVSRTLFAVWGEQNGQDDLRWYQAQRMSDGSYLCDISVSNHGQVGGYIVHAYVERTDGALFLLGQTSFRVASIPAASARSVTVSNYNASSGTFQVWVQGIQSYAGINQVRIPVWCSGDQSDIRWYIANRMSDGSYMAEVSTANHGYHVGRYQVHAYILENNGVQTFVGATAQDVSSNVSIGKLSVSNPDRGEMNYQISLSSTQLPGMTGVQFAVWADQGGQDDLKWYNASRYSDGSYACTISIGNHRQPGPYNVHAYGILSNGSTRLLGGTGFRVDSRPSARVQVANINENTGAFDIVVSNINAPSGVEKIQIPVWHAADQSDIRWYTAQRQSNGNYAVSANIANHNYNTGSYNVHVYITMGNGIMGCACGTVANINVSNQSKVQASRISDSEYQISLSAPWINGSGAKVLFPTWSNANGQDDIIWYEGIRSNNGSWYVNVDGKRHGTPGTFTTHVYIQSNGRSTLAGATSYTLNFQVQTRVARDANAIIASITNSSMDSGTKLRTCYNWVVNNISYQTLPIPLTPAEPGYTQEEWYAIYGMEQRRGNCYCYAASFAALARQLGYSATMISGSVPLRAGGWGPHGWVEIYMNGATYICDPESQHENPYYGFYMTTYATAPYQYRK